MVDSISSLGHMYSMACVNVIHTNNVTIHELSCADNLAPRLKYLLNFCSLLAASLSARGLPSSQQRDNDLLCTACMGNLLSLGAKMCIWNLTEGRSRNCDFKCNLGTYFCGVWIVFM